MERTLYLGLAPFQSARAIIEHDPGVLVVTPNTRAADSLQAGGRSLDDLAASELAWLGRRPISTLRARRVLGETVREILRVDDPAGYAAAIEPSIRAAYRAGIDLDALSSAASPRARHLALAAGGYRARLRRQNRIDPAELLHEAALVAPRRRRVLVAGYSRLGADEIAFLDQIAGPGSAACLPASHHPIFSENLATAKNLAARGWKIVWTDADPVGRGGQAAACFLGKAPGPAPVRATAHPNLEAEVRAVLGQVKELLVDGTDPGDVVVIVRDEAAYGPTALAVAWEYGLPLRALYAIPLAETRLGSWLRLALEVARRGFRYEQTLRLLAHPFGPGLTPETWDAVRQKRPSGPEAWAALGVDLAPFSWPAEASPADYVARLQQLFQVCEIRQKTGAWAREAIAYERLTDAWDDLVDPSATSLDFAAFVTAVDEALALLTVPIAPGRGGVELHTPLSVLGARYPHVFILGLAEGLLPSPPTDDPFLDFSARQQLIQEGFPFETPAEAAQREELSFWFTLLAAEQQLSLSYPRLLAGREALPSPFLQRLGLPRELPEGLIGARAASPEEARRALLRGRASADDPVLVAARHAWQIERRRESSAPPDAYDGIVGRPLDPYAARFSASRIVDLGQCPFKWFAAEVLKLAEPEEAEADLAPGVRGQLYHQVLQLALRRARGESDPRAIALECLEESFLQAEAEIALPPLPAWEVRRASHLRELRLAIQGKDFLRADATILTCEQWFRGNWRGLPVAGRVDRIDRRDAGLVLIDYKTSGSKPAGAKDAQGRARLDVQLPLYREVAAPLLFPGHPAAGYYYSLTEAKILSVDEPDDAALAGLVERVKTHLIEGTYPVDPDVDRAACRYCPFDLVCRKGPRLERKG